MEKVGYYCKELILVFCKVVTAVCIAVPLYLKVFFWGQKVNLGYEIFWQILFVSAVCSIGSIGLILSEEQEVSKWKYFMTKLLFFMYIDVVVIVSGYFFEWFHLSEPGQVVGMELVIISVYLIVLWVSYLTESKLTNQLNTRLRERNKEN